MATASTVSYQLLRVKAAADSIWEKAALMQLRLPDGSYWDTDSWSAKLIQGYNKISGSSNSTASYNTDEGIKEYNFNIDATAAAINAINVREYLGLFSDNTGDYLSSTDFHDATTRLISCEEKIHVPVGYNVNAFTIEGDTLSNLTVGTAKSEHIYKDKIAWVNGERLKGTLDTVYMRSPLGPYDGDKVLANNLLVSIQEGWENGSVDPSDLLLTNIPYRRTLTTFSETGSSSEDGTVGISQNINLSSYSVFNSGISYDYLRITPQSGYYDTAWSTDIKYAPSFPTEITVSRYKDPDNPDTTVQTVNTVTVPSGYYPSDIIITPHILDNEDNIESVLNYIDINLSGDADGNYTFTDGRITFKPETYSMSGPFDYFGNVTLNEATYNIEQDGTVNVSKGGWINKAVYGTPYGGLVELKSEDIINEITTEDPDVLDINSPKFSITVPLGKRTATGNVTRIYQVKLGLHSLTKAEDIFDFTNNYYGESEPYTGDIVQVLKQYGKITDILNPGWITGSTTEIYLKIADFLRASDEENTDDYYKIQRAGWIDPLSNWKYVATSVSDISNYNPINAVQPLKVDAGTVLSKGLNINPVTAGPAEYQLTDTDLVQIGTHNEAKFKLTPDMDEDGTLSDYMTEASIDMSRILQLLLKI